MSDIPTQPSLTANEDLSPIDPEKAKEALEKSLKHRPEKQELVDRHILPDSSVAPALQAAQKELERSRLQDSLDSKLKARPSPEEMVKHGLLERADVPVENK